MWWIRHAVEEVRDSWNSSFPNCGRTRFASPTFFSSPDGRCGGSGTRWPSPLTVCGELNKLASNIGVGRNIAGVHWRSDATESLQLGEAVAISVLRDQRPTYKQHFGGFTFTKFDGTRVTV